MNVIFVLAAAMLKLGAPFSDHAVLQRDQPVVVRGWAAAACWDETWRSV